MLVSEIIRLKRDRQELPTAAIDAMVRAIADTTASDAQVAAFSMAVLLNGMSPSETAQLTQNMRDTGDVFTWPDMPGPVVDKHSTGGVGDNVSLMLAPIMAACGCFVPMISGRGLGHTGGTLDKMDAIPGYVSQPDNALFDKTVREVGCAIIGQTAQLAPADKRLYAIRDVTATVESIPLITASILSKKLAAGLEGLVMDVKYGNGAFMQDLADARALAQSITSVAQLAGLKCHALLTDMNEPLADAAGNAVETMVAIDFLTGKRRTERLSDVVTSLCAQMLVVVGEEHDIQKARKRVTKVLENGAAAEVFAKMVAALGGPVDLIEKPSRYFDDAPVQMDVTAQSDGYVHAVDTREIGLAVVELGGGRRRAADQIDPRVGITDISAIGQLVSKGDLIARVHATSKEDAEHATMQLHQAIKLGEQPEDRALVAEILTEA